MEPSAPSITQPQGWSLVVLIVLLSVVFVAMGGIAMAVVEDYRATAGRGNEVRAVGLAQAGVMWGLYQFRQNGTVAPGTYNANAPTIPPGSSDDVFSLAGTQQADFQLVNMKSTTFTTAMLSSPACSPPRRDRMEGWRVRNVAAIGGPTVVIDQITVSWFPPGIPGEQVLRIDFNGSSPDWTAPNCTSGANSGSPIILTGLPLSQRSLRPAQVWATNRVWFTSTNTMGGKTWIDLTFALSDGTVRRARWNRLTPANRTADFTIRSLGQIRSDVVPLQVWRRVQAEYRTCWNALASPQCDSTNEENYLRPGNLLSYQELTQQSP